MLIVYFTSTSAITINCLFKEVYWMSMGLNYQCQAQPLGIGGPQYVTKAYGRHADNKTHADVTGIHFANCAKLTYIPKGILNIFPNLVGIYLDGCGIESLNGTELKEYPQLKVFALEKSSLSYVPGDLFAPTPDIELISFVANTIKSTGKNLLNDLTKLSEVYFEGNICIDSNATTTEEVPTFIETLESDCSIDSSIASEMFKSVSLILFLVGLAYFGKYIWIN